MENDYLRLILTSRVYDVCNETPITTAQSLSDRLGVKILLKREDLQPVFSFKLRGAYNMISQLSEEEKKKGVIACSAGNHAQGVAYSASYLKIPSTIVMPMATPSIKYSNVSRLGGKVVLFGEDFDAAKSHCKELSEKYNLTNIPPFDHPYVIAGQGTIGMEILRQTKKLKAIFVCVGGGGLCAGICVYIKRIDPTINIFAVETHDSCALKKSLEKGERVSLNEVGLFSDGTAVKLIGEEPFKLCKKYVDGSICVNTDEICATIKDIFEVTRTIVEPAGALSLAGLKKFLNDPSSMCYNPHNENPNPKIHTKLPDDEYLVVLSGANMNFDRLRFVAERAMLGEGNEVLMVVTIPDVPGSFKTLHSIILPRAITEFSYRQNSHLNGKANIFVSFSVKNRNFEIANVLKGLKEHGFEGTDVSHDEFAKTHARYLIGGHSDSHNERLFRFEFPERPNALKNFLDGIHSQWNITLFHYRNNGSDIGKVLTAINIPPSDNLLFEDFLHRLAYPYIEETDNDVFKKYIK